MSYIQQNMNQIKQKIKDASVRSGRGKDEIAIVAVTKTVKEDKIREAVKFGITGIGENKVQEALGKYKVLGDIVSWHMVGHLQTNKVKDAVKIFKMIHSVDSLKLAREISKRAGEIEKNIDILIEVNVSGEESKYGINPEEALGLLGDLSGLSNIKVLGLMTMAPFVDDPEAVRPVFRSLRELRDKIKETNIPNIEMKYLSMGMTQDFEVAVEEGANMVRIGTAIFGERKVV